MPATTDTAEQWLNQNSAGTGPFVMTKYVPDSEVDVQKFAGYWKGDAPFDRVIYRNIPTAATQKLTLQAGDIDIATEISPDSVGDLQSDPQSTLVQGQGADIFFLLMNQNPALTNGAMSNPQVQLAVRYALDYDGINALVGGPAADAARRSCRSASWAPMAPIARSSVTWAWPRRCSPRPAIRTASTSTCSTRPTSRAAA